MFRYKKAFLIFIASISIFSNVSSSVNTTSKKSYRSLVYSLVHTLSSLEQYNTQCQRSYIARKWQRHIDIIQYSDHLIPLSRNTINYMIREGRSIISNSYYGCPHDIKSELYYLKKSGIKLSKKLSYINKHSIILR